MLLALGTAPCTNSHAKQRGESPAVGTHLVIDNPEALKTAGPHGSHGHFLNTINLGKARHAPKKAMLALSVKSTEFVSVNCSLPEWPKIPIAHCRNGRKFRQCAVTVSVNFQIVGTLREFSTEIRNRRNLLHDSGNSAGSIFDSTCVRFNLHNGSETRYREAQELKPHLCGRGWWSGHR